MNALPPGNVEISNYGGARDVLQLGRKGYEKVAKHLGEHVEECLLPGLLGELPPTHAYLSRPRASRPGDKAQVVGIFPNRDACLDLVSVLVAEQSEE